MDEFNLASRFAEDEDEVPRRGRGKIKRLRKRGVGLEKPEDVEVPEEEDLDMEDEELPDLPMDEGGFPGFGPDEDMEEDEAFTDLVDRLEGASASMGRRRAKMKGRRPAPRGREDEEE